MYAVYETKSPLLSGKKGFPGFSDDTAGKKEGEMPKTSCLGGQVERSGVQYSWPRLQFSIFSGFLLY